MGVCQTLRFGLEVYIKPSEMCKHLVLLLHVRIDKNPLSVLKTQYIYGLTDKHDLHVQC
jgi:hypothetical protein